MVLLFAFRTSTRSVMLLMSFARGARTWVSRPAVEVARLLMPSMGCRWCCEPVLILLMNVRNWMIRFVQLASCFDPRR